MAVLIALLMGVPLPSLGGNVTTFEGGQASAVVDFAGAGTVSDAAVIPWNYTAVALNATMDITPGPHTPGGTDYPLTPSITIGGQTAPAWAYNGTGYGSYGLQNGFADGSLSASQELRVAGKLETPVLLPDGARVTKASVTVGGDVGTGRYSDSYNMRISVNDVSYSQRFNALFMGQGSTGVLVKSLTDGSLRRIDSYGYPALNFTNIYALQFDDSTGLLFVATDRGVQVINYTTMEIVDVINRYSDIHTLGDTITSLRYDPVSKILALGEYQFVDLFNYSSRSLIGYVKINAGWDYAYSVEIAGRMIWAGTYYGVQGIDLDTMGIKYHYDSTSTTPTIVSDYVVDLHYDAGSDRLYIACPAPGSWANGGVSIIKVAAGTKVADIHPWTNPALPSTYSTGVELDTASDKLFVSTQGGGVVYKASTVAEIARFNPGTNPAVAGWVIQDIKFYPAAGLLVVGTSDGASILNTNSNTNVLNVTSYSSNPTFPRYSFNAHQTDAARNRIFVRHDQGVSILNLTTNVIDRNLTNVDLFMGQSLQYTSDMLYNAESNLLIVAGNVGNNNPVLSVYDLTAWVGRAFYNRWTGPGLPQAYDVQGIVFNASSRILAFHQWYSTMIINLNNNASRVLTWGSTPSYPNNWCWVSGLDYDQASNTLFACIPYVGVYLFNLTSNTVSSITTGTNPALANDYPRYCVHDPTRGILLVAYYYVGLDVFNLSPLSRAARFSINTNPAIIQTTVNQLRYNRTDQMVYLVGSEGATVIDYANRKVLRNYTTTSLPPVTGGAVLTFDAFGARDWDIVCSANLLQIMKPDPYPNNAELRVGGRRVWNLTGTLSGTVDVTGFAIELQTALAAGKKRPADIYGNKLTEVTLAVTTQRAGKLSISKLAIEYAHTVTTHDLSAALNDYINSTGGRPASVPVAASSASAGKLTLGGLNILIDEAPFFNPFPLDLMMRENTIEMKLVDLWSYVHDDNDNVEKLTLQAEAASNSSRVNVGVFNSRYLYVDSLTKPESVNWTGEVQVVLIATDTRNLTRRSEPMVVHVEPLYDIVITSSPVSTTYEDMEYVYTVTAVSHRALSLTYSLDSKPTGMTINASTGTIRWTPDDPDVGIRSVTVNVTDGHYSAVQRYDLTILPVEDAPVLSGLGNLTVLEGVPLTIDVSKYVSDEDDEPAKLAYKATSTYVSVSGPIMSFLYPKNSGMTQENVTIFASDSKYSANVTIRVTILGIFTVDPLPDQSVVEGAATRLVLSTYLHDPQGRTLTVSSDSKYVTVFGPALDLLYPVGCGLTEDNLTVRVSDGSPANDTLVKLKVRITPVFPTVAITQPAAGAKCTGDFKVTGTAAIASSSVTRVEVRIDGSNWEAASGTVAWTYSLSTKRLVNGVHSIQVRAFSGNVTSQVAQVDFTLEKPKTPGVSVENSSVVLGLMLGLIIAAVVGIAAYTMGRKKGGAQSHVDDIVGPEEGAGGARDAGEPDDKVEPAKEDFTEEPPKPAYEKPEVTREPDKPKEPEPPAAPPKPPEPVSEPEPEEALLTARVKDVSASAEVRQDEHSTELAGPKSKPQEKPQEPAKPPEPVQTARAKDISASAEVKDESLEDILKKLV